MEHLDITTQRVIGLSGGSIVAALYCAGMGSEDMEDWTYRVNFDAVVRLFPPRLLFKGGMCSGRRFEAWMDKRLRGARFKDLQRDLVVVATDIRTRQPAVFSQAHVRPKLVFIIGEPQLCKAAHQHVRVKNPHDHFFTESGR